MNLPPKGIPMLGVGVGVGVVTVGPAVVGAIVATKPTEIIFSFSFTVNILHIDFIL